MNEILSGIVAILYEAAPFLVLGFAFAGAIHVLLARYPRVTALLTGSGRMPIVWAALIGLPMSLCSCSVLPAARALRKEGASKGATASFLISVPETDVVSIFATLALIGPLFAVYRPTAAIIAALAAGFVVRAIELRERNGSVSQARPSSHDSCCNDDAVAAPGAPWWKRALRYGFVEVFDDIAPQLVLGILIAAVIGAWLPSLDPRLVSGGTWISYVVMVAIGVPLYVCASASTPIAAGLIAGGASPGAAMVFLLSGPATNLASLTVIRGELGTRGLFGYLFAIVAVSVGCGVLMDTLVDRYTLPTFTPSHMHGTHSPLEVALTIVFVAMIAWSFHRTRVIPRLWRGVRAKLS